MLKGPPSMGSKQRLEDDANCEIEECEAAGADSTKGAEGGTKGHVRVGKGIGMGVFAAPLSHLVPGLLLVGQQYPLRQKLVD